MLRGLVIAAACALLLAIVPAGASAATPQLSSLQAQDLARTAKGVSAIAVKNPLAQWSCVYASDSAFWNCALNAASDGQPLAVTFADYRLPTMSVVPDLEILLTEDAPSPLNPLGIKGGGESAITAVGAVIAAAIDDALATPGAVRQLPVTPQRLRTLLKAGIALPA